MTQIEVRIAGALSDIAKSLERIEQYLKKMTDKPNTFGGVTFSCKEENNTYGSTDN